MSLSELERAPSTGRFPAGVTVNPCTWKSPTNAMRALLVPEIYRRDDLSTNGTVTDAVIWVDDWLERDSRLHVYWLLPPRETADYAPADVRADRDGHRGRLQ